MAIGFLQQQAFGASPDFNAQVNGVVKQQALLQSEKIDGNNPQYATWRQTLAQVSSQPQDWGFVNTLIGDAGWAVTYDGWSANPAGSEGAILAGVQKWWSLRTGLEFLP